MVQRHHVKRLAGRSGRTAELNVAFERSGDSGNEGDRSRRTGANGVPRRARSRGRCRARDRGTRPVAERRGAGIEPATPSLPSTRGLLSAVTGCAKDPAILTFPPIPPAPLLAGAALWRFRGASKFAPRFRVPGSTRRSSLARQPTPSSPTSWRTFSRSCSNRRNGQDHVARIFSKLDIHDRAQAVLLAYESRIVRPAATTVFWSDGGIVLSVLGVKSAGTMNRAASPDENAAPAASPR
jgi:hypothetical protein